MTRIVIAGGAGLLGQALAEYFTAAGRQVIILTRQTAAAKPPGPVKQLTWSGTPTDRPQVWESHLAGADALINLAGRSVNCRYTQKHRRQIMDSRILSTRALAQALARCPHPPPVWINSSTATIYQHTFGHAHNESGTIAASPQAHDAFSIQVATAWERELFNSQPNSPPALRKIALRTAIVLSHRPGNVVPILRRLTRLGLGGRMGSGRQWVSWIHERDFCRAVDFLLTHPQLSGPVNLAAPNPLTNATMMHAFRTAYHRPIGVPAARWMLEIGAFFLRTETELLLKSRRVVPAKLLAAGFHFEFPAFDQALANLARPSSQGHSK